MSAVYEAHDGEGHKFAVKVMNREIAVRSTAAVTRFINEARATASLQSPHIVAVLDGGVDQELRLPYLVMELLRGFDVEGLLQRHGPLDPTAAVRIVIQAAQGLSAAHAAGIVHRDIKPSNIFLEERADGSFLVKVCDFGTAKITDPQGNQITRTGALLGSPLYMSPEQARSSKHVDSRADVWSLGITLYRLLCGRTPHESCATFADLVTAIASQNTPLLQDFAPWVEPGLATVVHAALLRDPSSRWPTVAKFSRALFAFAENDIRVPRDMLGGVTAERRAQVAERARIPEVAPLSFYPPPREEDRLLGTTLLGRYKLEKQLGRGGMGAVYEAAGLDGKRYAVKVVLDEANQSPEALRRFVREAKDSGDIVDPHVVSVIEADTDLATRTPFIVMELLSGTDLDRLIEATGPLEPRLVARLFRQACLGLAAAHRRAIVHRDIKPANLFLHSSDRGEISVKICDFGIAKRTSTDAINQSTAALTATGGLLGSPIYMSPEQARNAKNVDLRTDIWSLCVSMYQALSGSQPWNHCTTVGELILAICTEELPSLSRVAPWVDSKLVAVVERGLRRDLSQRWASIEALYAALEPFCDGADQVTKDMLSGVPLEVRWQSVEGRVDANAATLAASDSQSSSSDAIAVSNAAALSLADTRSKKTPGVIGALAFGAALGAVVAGYFFYQRATQHTPAAAASPEASLAAPVAPAAAPATPEVSIAAATAAKVRIDPLDATVQVDGSARLLQGGFLTLTGEPGDVVTVVASVGSRRIERRVSLLKGGFAEPNTIVVPPEEAQRKQAKPAAKSSAGAKAAAAPAAPTPGRNRCPRSNDAGRPEDPERLVTIG